MVPVVEADLLPGEDPTVDDLVEVEQWIALYEVRRQIWLRRARRARGEVAGVDEERARIDDRLAFWRRRHVELGGVLSLGGDELAGLSGPVALTRREAQLLRFLADNPGQRFPAAVLLRRAWPDQALSEEQLRTYVSRLRRKLSEAGGVASISAERPKGYLLQVRPGGLGREPSR